MCKVVSIIPPQNDGELTRTQGTKVLLDNGEYLRGVRSIRLECDPDSFWKAFIEVAPTNQKQIDALIAGVEVNKPLTCVDQVKSIDEQIKELEFKRDVLNGTHILKQGERIIPVEKHSDASDYLAKQSTQEEINDKATDS